MTFGSFGAPGISSEQGPYTAWVSRLESWSKDPTTSLEGLPKLDERTFERSTYSRLNDHLYNAIQTFMDRWVLHLESAFGRAKTTHELGVELVQLRNSLRPRLALARHPGLPEEIRSALETGLAKDLAGIQQQLEENVRTSTARGSVDPSAIDLMISVVHENSMTALLTTTDLTDIPWQPEPEIHLGSGATTQPRKLFPDG